MCAKLVCFVGADGCCMTDFQVRQLASGNRSAATDLEVRRTTKVHFYRPFTMTKFYAFLCFFLPCPFLWSQKTYTAIRLEERPLFDKGGIFLEYPALERQYTAPMPGEFTDQYNPSKTWAAAKFSTRLPGKVGVGVYSTVLGPSSIIFGNNNGPSVGFSTQPITGLSNYTLLTVEKALANNSWVSLTNASLWGAQPAHNNLSTLNFQLRDPGNTYQLAGNVQVNTPSGGDTVLQANSPYQFSVGKVNGAWTWELAHLKNKYLSTDLLNSTNRLFAPYGEYYSSTAQIGYRDFTPRGWRQNTSSFFKLTRNRRPKAENFNYLVAEVGISALSQRFQQWDFTMSSDLHDNSRRYYFVGATLDRRVTPRAQAALSFNSDYRRRFYYQLALQAGGNLGGEQANLQSSMQLSWAIAPRLRLRLDNGVSIFTRELEGLSGIPVTGYYLKQYDVRSITSNLELNWQ